MTEQTTESAATDAAMALHELVRAVEQGIYCAPEELVARARAVAVNAAALLDAAEAVQRVRALHQPVRVQTGTKTHGGPNEYGEICGTCRPLNAYREEWPCPTIRALEVPGE